MSKVNELNEVLTELDQKYFEAKKALEHSRLEAALTDAAQAVVDRDQPGKQVVDIAISTDPNYLVKDLIEALTARVLALTEENVKLKAELGKDNGSREA